MVVFLIVLHIGYLLPLCIYGIQYKLMPMQIMEWKILFMNLYLYRLSFICKRCKSMDKTTKQCVFSLYGRLLVSSFRLIGGLRHRQRSTTCDARPLRLNPESNAIDLTPGVGDHVFLQCCVPWEMQLEKDVNAQNSFS